MSAFSTKYIQYDALEFSKKKNIFVCLVEKPLHGLELGEHTYDALKTVYTGSSLGSRTEPV